MTEVKVGSAAPVPAITEAAVEHASEGKVADKLAPRAAERADNVLVKPRRFFREDPRHIVHDGDNKPSGEMTPDSQPYETTRAHAAELRANSLVDYVDAADEDAAIEDEAAAAGETVRVRRRRGPTS